MRQRLPRPEWLRTVAIGGALVIMLMAPGSALANESEVADGSDAVEELLARIAAEREALAATRRQQEDVEAELEALRTRLEALEAETEARRERLRRLENDTER